MARDPLIPRGQWHVLCELWHSPMPEEETVVINASWYYGKEVKREFLLSHSCGSVMTWSTIYIILKKINLQLLFHSLKCLIHSFFSLSQQNNSLYDIFKLWWPLDISHVAVLWSFFCPRKIHSSHCTIQFTAWILYISAGASPTGL